MLFRFHSNRWTKEFKIFPSLFFGFEKPALAIPNLAHLLLPSSDTNAIAKPKELNFCPFQYGALCALMRLSLRSVTPQATGVRLF